MIDEFEKYFDHKFYDMAIFTDSSVIGMGLLIMELTASQAAILYLFP